MFDMLAFFSALAVLRTPAIPLSAQVICVDHNADVTFKSTPNASATSRAHDGS